MESIWSKDIIYPEFESLTKDIKTDVLIIGGGITGILCGYMLKEAGIECVIVEAGKICSGITKNTTAKITSQHGLIYSKMLERFGVDVTRLYGEAQQEALSKYRQLCKNIPCDFEECDFYVYSKNNPKVIEKEIIALEKIGRIAEFTETVPLPFSVKGAVRVKNQAQFHPLKFIYSIAENIKIFENTKVTEIRPDAVATEYGNIKAKKIIVATHFPFINKHGSYFLKLYQHRSYVIAYKNVLPINGMYVDEDIKGMSFRQYNNMILIGGGGHRTGKKGGNWKEISDFVKKNYQSADEVERWSTQDCMTLDEIPYIGQYSKNTPNLYVATGFNKWGMTSAMISALILTDVLQNKRNKYETVFSPSRSILRPQLLVNTLDSVMGLITPTAPRCPHMGCALKYNSQEHSWDCPCHGSRFDKNGKLINNPSNNNLKK